MNDSSKLLGILVIVGFVLGLLFNAPAFMNGTINFGQYTVGILGTAIGLASWGVLYLVFDWLIKHGILPPLGEKVHAFFWGKQKK